MQNPGTEASNRRLGARAYLRDLAVPVRHAQWLAAIRIIQGLIAGITRAFWNAESHGKSYLQFIHARLHLMLSTASQTSAGQ